MRTSFLSESTEAEVINDITMRLQYAEINLQQEPLLNAYLYNALSHLSMIEELKLELLRYDKYRLAPLCHELDEDLVVFTKSKMNEAFQVLSGHTGVLVETIKEEHYAQF